MTQKQNVWHWLISLYFVSVSVEGYQVTESSVEKEYQKLTFL